MKASEFKERIDVTMEAVPESSMARLVKIRCVHCPRNCDVSFSTRNKLSFASVGRLVGVFSTLCGKLEKMDVAIDVPDGPQQATLPVDSMEA